MSGSRSERPKFPAFNSSYDDAQKRHPYSRDDDRLPGRADRALPPRVPAHRDIPRYPETRHPPPHPQRFNDPENRRHRSGSSHTISPILYPAQTSATSDQQDDLFNDYNAKKSVQISHPSTSSDQGQILRSPPPASKLRKISHEHGLEHGADNIVIQVQSRPSIRPPFDDKYDRNKHSERYSRPPPRYDRRPDHYDDLRHRPDNGRMDNDRYHRIDGRDQEPIRYIRERPQSNSDRNYHTLYRREDYRPRPREPEVRSDVRMPYPPSRHSDEGDIHDRKRRQQLFEKYDIPDNASTVYQDRDHRRSYDHPVYQDRDRRYDHPSDVYQDQRRCDLPVLQYERQQDTDWRSRPPPPETREIVHDTSNMDRETSDLVDSLIHEALNSQKVQETIETTKSLISSIIPQTVDNVQSQANTMPRNAPLEQLENPVYSTPVPHPDSLAAHIQRGPPKSKFVDAFSRTAAMYASKWGTDKSCTSNSESLPVGDAAYSADFPVSRERMIDVSTELQICFEDISLEQLDLVFKYFNGKRTLRQLFFKMTLRVAKHYTPTDDENTEDVISVLVNKAPMYYKKVERPEPVEGLLDCKECKLWNMTKDQYQDHVNTDLHVMIGHTWFKKLYAMPKSLPKYSMIFCIPCHLYFMINFNGGTLVGHEHSKTHESNISFWRLRYPQSHNPPSFCLLTSLRTTSVCMPSPSECKYLKPREAFEAYKVVYSKLVEKRLATDN